MQQVLVDGARHPMRQRIKRHVPDSGCLLISKHISVSFLETMCVNSKLSQRRGSPQITVLNLC